MYFVDGCFFVDRSLKPANAGFGGSSGSFETILGASGFDAEPTRIPLNTPGAALPRASDGRVGSTHVL